LINGHPHKRRASIFIVILWIFSTAPPRALAQNDEEIEYPAKLAFLYNFAKFIEWPLASYSFPGAPFVVCIAGRDPFRSDDESELRTRTVLGHPIQIRALRVTGTLSACNIAFIPVTENDQAGNILRGFKGSSTLTVGETQGFAARGGVINLTVEGNRLRFEINQMAAERAGLKISSKLFSLAKIVTDDQGRPQ
jgi:hypothetical protein